MPGIEQDSIPSLSAQNTWRKYKLQKSFLKDWLSFSAHFYPMPSCFTPTGHKAAPTTFTTTGLLLACNFWGERKKVSAITFYHTRLASGTASVVVQREIRETKISRVWWVNLFFFLQETISFLFQLFYCLFILTRAFFHALIHTGWHIFNKQLK